ncbi:MAG: hypothetical protein ACRDBO_18665 [Lachnospiraceae bacterium]
MDNKNDWKQDPRLNQMNKEKLDYLTDMVSQIQTMKKDQLMTAFAAMQMDSMKKGMNFTSEETDLLASVITAEMSPAEKKRMESLRTLAKKMAAKKS